MSEIPQSGYVVVNDPEGVVATVMDSLTRKAPHAANDLDRRGMKQLDFRVQIAVATLKDRGSFHRAGGRAPARGKGPLRPPPGEQSSR
jgi:hypothetical protein